MMASSAQSSTGSPCAACKFLRRKCMPECVFAPYFPPENPQKFASVHKIFGASNVSKLLNELPLHQREDAVNSLAYEAEARIKDPVYGCVGAISVLQRHVSLLQKDLALARSELACYATASSSSAAISGLPQLMATPQPHMQQHDEAVDPAALFHISREQLNEYARYVDPSSLLLNPSTNPYPQRAPGGSGSSHMGHLGSP